ncbi:MAG TPA: choice-of-anchor tandem repeat GloVer-containing protein [Candidatus Cybelea sp.]|nr:choice-of-anchor tandem repeat GloVer-containing protein [Candidatus Cybelea sp.]
MRTFAPILYALTAVAAMSLLGCAKPHSQTNVAEATKQAQAVTAPASSSTYKVLYRFDGRDGYPNTRLLRLGDNLYGTTSGAVYRISTHGVEKTLYRFDASSEPFMPAGGLIEVNGTLYGTTSYGGTSSTRDANGTGKGGIYTLSKQGKANVFYAFKGAPDGATPNGGLIDVGGTLYGTTAYGGSKCRRIRPGGFAGCGTVYSISPSGVERVLYSFGGGADGANPIGALIDVDGTLYGTTFVGGGSNCPMGRGNGCGTVYSVSPSGKEKVLYRFPSCCGNDGAAPNGGLINVNGTLYGTTLWGGTGDPGMGTVYSLTAGGRESVLYTFRGGSDGIYPSDLIEVNGRLYGTTERGGDSNCGTLFSIAMSPGAKQMLHTFACGSDGARPGFLTEVRGKLYGTTNGPENNEPHNGDESLNAQGTIFALTP